MESLYLWPDKPGLSLLVIFLVSSAFLWAARDPMLQVIRNLGKSLEGGLRAVADWCAETASAMAARSSDALLAASELELQTKMERELQKVDSTFSDKLGQYAGLHRRLDDLLMRADADYRKCGDSPPDVPGWSAAVEAVSAIPTSGDSNVEKVLEGIRGSMRDSEKKALRQYRDATGKRHGLLGRMRPDWKEIRTLMARMQDAITRALDTTSKIDRYVDEYGQIVKEREIAARILTYTAWKPFLVSLIVLGVALGAAFINFQLIALPMSELVPAGARIGGMPVSTVSALIIVLLETAVGIFVMDMLGITDLFPKLAAVPTSRRRLILGCGFAALFVLASVESSLAILREQIVEAESALKLSLAGEASVIARPTHSVIPVVGQAALGFALPWILALVAVPLEMFLDSGRHVLAGVSVMALRAVGHSVRAGAHLVRGVATALPSLYDIYISIWLRLERAARSHGPRTPASAPARPKPTGPVKSEGVA